MTFEIGSTAYIVESNRIIREVTIVKRNGDFYIIRFGTRGGIQVRSNRLFASYEDADSSIHKKTEKRTGYYLHYPAILRTDVLLGESRMAAADFWSSNEVERRNLSDFAKKYY